MAITINGTTGITTTGDYDAEDNDKILLGTGDDLQIFHDGSHSFIKDTGTGNLKICSDLFRVNNAANDEAMIKAEENAGVTLSYNGNTRLETDANGIHVTTNVHLPDNGVLELGTGTDATIKHSGSDFLISNGTGTFDIKCTSGTGAGEGAIKFHIGSGTEALSINNSGGLNHTSSTDNMITSSIAGAIRMQLTHTGGGDVSWSNPSSGSASYSTSSDYRLKQNVIDLPNAWTTVKALKPYEYKWKHNTSRTSQGFFAHEVIATIPNSEAGQGTKDAVDSDSNPIYQQIDYSKLVPVLTKALQEAITEIETLKTKVAALEAA